MDLRAVPAACRQAVAGVLHLRLFSEKAAPEHSGWATHTVKPDVHGRA